MHKIYFDNSSKILTSKPNSSKQHCGLLQSFWVAEPTCGETAIKVLVIISSMRSISETVSIPFRFKYRNSAPLFKNVNC